MSGKIGIPNLFGSAFKRAKDLEAEEVDFDDDSIMFNDDTKKLMGKRKRMKKPKLSKDLDADIFEM